MNSCKLLLVLLLCCSLQLHARTHSVADSTEVLGEVDSAHPIQTYAPLLKYVFFEKGSAEIPKRYLMFTSPQEANKFTLDSAHGGTYTIYYHILNIIGYRLRNHPTSKLTIVGCNDNNTMRTSPEELREGLSKQRATIVYNYLKDIWQIPETQLKLLYRNLPERPSNPKDSLGILENRRVELQCDDWEISKPLNVGKGYFFKKDMEEFTNWPVLSVSLIQFTFNSMQMGQLNERVLTEYVMPVIMDSDVINITTINFEEPLMSHPPNPNECAKFLKYFVLKSTLNKKSIKVNASSSYGSELYMDYQPELPETHFYNRGARITVERKK
ncbi:MAG: hypothetical protein U0Y96_16255 [Candidatus Kapaibacterium sp.]